ncbi:hypothetical protein XELAEV_18032846mg [Xenopus laevis]|uniref:Uncharacterized protein n=1 Tax=Xenopus laevis TaxID=8355 RepID=A0A974CID6_XENLA|nr:hypothetical protein XELAEV_18032846mg [Xenopus laevis]
MKISQHEFCELAPLVVVPGKHYTHWISKKVLFVSSFCHSKQMRVYFFVSKQDSAKSPFCSELASQFHTPRFKKGGKKKKKDLRKKKKPNQ